MSTFGDMQTRIANELKRTDLTSEIKLAINDAINDYDGNRFWFNEERDATAFTTVLGQEFYTVADAPVIASMRHIDTATVFVFNSRWVMHFRTPQYMEWQSVNPSWNAIPEDWSYYNETIRLYPIPNGAYPVYLSGTMQIAPTPLSSDNDSNVWTNEAEQLIRYCAKRKMFSDLLRDPDQMQINKALEDNQFNILQSETAKRGGPATIRPTQW